MGFPNEGDRRRTIRFHPPWRPPPPRGTSFRGVGTALAIVAVLFVGLLIWNAFLD